PELKNLRSVKKGAILVAPLVPGVAAAPSQSKPLLISELQQVRDALDSFIEELSQSAGRERMDITNSVTLVKSQEMKQLADAIPEVVPYIKQALSGLSEREKDNAQSDALLKRLKSAAGELEQLSEALARL